MEKSLKISDIRNKLSPITTLIALLEVGNIPVHDSYVQKALEQSKISVNYLSDREVYTEDEI